jgi:predicted NAD/FAD-binding protein
VKLAIIGGGISGLTAAHYLHPHHDVSLFEANDYVGGHTNTIEVVSSGQTFAVDTGFIVFNYDTYPNFTHMLNELGWNIVGPTFLGCSHNVETWSIRDSTDCFGTSSDSSNSQRPC